LKAISLCVDLVLGDAYHGQMLRIECRGSVCGDTDVASLAFDPREKKTFSKPVREMMKTDGESRLGLSIVVVGCTSNW
jgi:hypothetical protein